MRSLKVLFVSPEVAPFAKTGGLADVCGILPLILASLGAQVQVFLPYYRQVKEKRLEIKLIRNNLSTKLGNADIDFSLYGCQREKVNFYFIGKDEYYDREFLYGTPSADYPDNALRFAFLASAALTSAMALNFKAEIVHCNDWQTALIPFYLRFKSPYNNFFNQTKTLFTIHNLAYQGLFIPPEVVMPSIGIDIQFFTPETLEFYGKLSFMKSGILYASAVSTVSKGYAREILQPEFGCGLDGLLNVRKNDLYGVLNGADYTEWNPKTDQFIVSTYDKNSLQNKVKCKKDLLEQMKLPAALNAPLLGVVTRLAEQKGIDIIAGSIKELVELGANLVILGTGDAKYHALLTVLAKKYAKHVAVKIAFDNALAHKIEAGSDMFLMPSRYEPCGLNQMYSLKYGTIPVVRATGGLDDTIIDYSLDHSGGNGFKFTEAGAADFIGALERAISIYRNKKEWQNLMVRAMELDFSWKRSAREYIRIYQLLKR